MMLDPHVCNALLPVDGQPGLYYVASRMPDRHAVFKFALNYCRGRMMPKVAMTVPVVPA